MEYLTQEEKGAFLKLFIRGGYVLNFFENSDFDAFTMNSVGVQLCTKYKASKGKSLNSFVAEASQKDALKLLRDLLEYYESGYAEELDDNVETKKLYKRCREAIDRIDGKATPLASNAESLQERFSSEYLSDQIKIMIDMQTANPTDAIGKAKELIESCCKTILENSNVTWDKSWNMNQLVDKTLKFLAITPQNVPDTEPIATKIKAVLGNLRGITANLAEIRNLYGSGHGKSASFTGLEVRHAKLAVGCSITVATFLWDTYEEMLEQ